VSLYAYIFKPDALPNGEAAGVHYVCMYKHTIYSNIVLSLLSICSVCVCFQSVIKLLAFMLRVHARVHG
jgi:hypothetical protein